ncbi:hypothetical protein ACE103_17005 [Bradyrhizobium sp. ma5]|uniref:hypothetical protein n=1 Tax=Bradyrhizobium sp. ma5 TaxID=3344828 RepID=UPI0035D46996
MKDGRALLAVIHTNADPGSSAGSMSINGQVTLFCLEPLKILDQNEALFVGSYENASLLSDFQKLPRVGKTHAGKQESGANQLGCNGNIGAPSLDRSGARAHPGRYAADA